MMSLIILINGLVCMITGILFYFYVHEFKSEITKNRMLTYFIFGAYFIFNGFLRIKVVFLGEFEISDFDIFNNVHLFALLGLLSNTLFGVFIFNSIKKEKDVINSNKT